MTTRPEWHSDSTFGLFSGISANGHDPDEVLTPKEAAAFLKITPRQFRVLAEQGKFKRLDLGKKTKRYLRKDLIQAGRH